MSDELKKIMDKLGCGTREELYERDAIELYATCRNMGIEPRPVLDEIEMMLKEGGMLDGEGRIPQAVAKEVRSRANDRAR